MLIQKKKKKFICQCRKKVTMAGCQYRLMGFSRWSPSKLSWLPTIKTASYTRPPSRRPTASANGVISNDVEWLSEILNDMRHSAASLRQLSFLYCFLISEWLLLLVKFIKHNQNYYLKLDVSTSIRTLHQKKLVLSSSGSWRDGKTPCQ